MCILSGHTNGVASATFSPDGVRIVTAGWDGTAKIWDAQSGRELFTLTGYTDALWDAELSLDGRRIVTCSRDGTARIWDVPLLLTIL